jgi:hypothetical protein
MQNGDESEYIDTIKSKELRADKSLIYSKLELEFFDNKSKKNKRYIKIHHIQTSTSFI